MAIGAALAPFPRWRVFDNLGAVAPGALLHTYAAGGVVDYPTWSDSALAVQNANPLVASASGLFGPIYLAFGQSYHFLLTTAAGVTIWDQDNIADQQASVLTITLAGPQDNLVVPPGTTYLRLNNPSTLAISGMAAGTDGQILHIVSVGAGNVGFIHQGSGSVAASRLINFVTGAATGESVTYLTGGSGSATYIYDGTSQRWRMTQFEQGVAIAVPYSATNFTASAGTWVVAAGDQVTYRYYLKGRLLTVMWQITTSEVTGTPLALLLRIPGEYLCNTTLGGPFHLASDNGGAAVAGAVKSTASGSTIALYKDATANANWANSAAPGLTTTQGELTLEVT